MSARDTALRRAVTAAMEGHRHDVYLASRITNAVVDALQDEGLAELNGGRAEVRALPAEWECCHGPTDDEPFCAEDDRHDGSGEDCPLIRVHRDDAERFAAVVDQVHNWQRVAASAGPEIERLNARIVELETERDRVRAEVLREAADRVGDLLRRMADAAEAGDR